MEQWDIFSATLGLSPPWQVTEVTFAKESNRLDICVEYDRSSPLDCPVCGAQGVTCQAAAEIETWFHQDFFNYSTYLHARVPLLSCCGDFPRPWCRAGSRFAKV